MLTIMGEVASAAGAAAGLILVFFGSALNAFDQYDETQKASVRAGYRWRAWPALVALVSAAASCGLALYAKGAVNEATALWSIVFLAIAGVAVVAAAIHAVIEIG